MADVLGGGLGECVRKGGDPGRKGQKNAGFYPGIVIVRRRFAN